MTKRKAILHIGTMKTGTSSIQATLAQSPDWLAARGVTFEPGVQRTPAQIALRADAVAPGGTLIISDEGLWHHARTDRSDTAAIAKVLSDFDVTVIVYFRRPDQFIEAWFSQGLKHGRGAPSLAAFMASPFRKVGCEFYRRLKIFADLFGPSAIRIAPYEKAQLAQGDVVTDFLIRCGLAGPQDTHDSLIASGLKYPPKQNVSPDANVILLVSLLRQLGHLPEAALKQTLDAVPLTARKDVGRILLPQEVAAINTQYRPVFRRLQAEYGGGAVPDFFLDWDMQGDRQAACAMRATYDQLLALPDPKPALPVAAAAPAAPTVPSTVPPPKRLRVVFVIQKLAGLTGGAERVFIETAQAMIARGMDVRVVTFDAGRASSLFGRNVVPMQSLFPQQRGPRKASALAIRLLKSTPNIPPLTHLKWRLSHGMFVRRLKADLIARPADVVVAFLPPAITAAAFAVAGLPTRLVASTHNVPELDFGDGPRWDQNPLYRQRALQALARAARVTVLLEDFRAWFPESVRRRVVHMPNPVARLSAPSPQVGRKKVILGIGRLTRIKRWDLLITAFARAAADLPGWQVHLYGEGPEKTALQAQIDAAGLGGRVILMGTTRGIGPVYDRASLLVHPSEFEGFGLSVAEAMAHGLPAVAFADCAGVNMLIRDGDNGILLPRSADAAGDLAACLVTLAKDDALRTRLGQNAPQIMARFDRSAIYGKWARLLREVAGT